MDDAASYHHVNAVVLRAIGWQESRLNPRALNRNADGSIDVGAFQINSVHFAELKRHGIGPDALEDGCVCAYVAAWHYARQVSRYGNTWQAVGAYHSLTPALLARYANGVARTLIGWGVLAPAALPFPTAGLSGPPAGAPGPEGPKRSPHRP